LGGRKVSGKLKTAIADALRFAEFQWCKPLVDSGIIIAWGNRDTKVTSHYWRDRTITSKLKPKIYSFLN
jgi:hypothetical protein